MRWSAVGSLLVAGLLAGLLGGCASSAPAPFVDPLAKPAGREVAPPATAFAASSRAPAGTTSATWSAWSGPHTASTTRVYLGVVVPVCSGKDGVFNLTTTNTRIEIGYWVYPSHPPCVASITYANGYIQLPSPIGRRGVVHVPAGRRA